MTAPTKRTRASSAFRSNNGLASAIITQLIIWAPIVIGVVHQVLMYFGRRPLDEDGRATNDLFVDIPVFVDPPGSIGPIISLEYQWWYVLLIGASILTAIAYSRRFGSVPTRFSFLGYAYIIFLLIFVKPI